MRLFISAEERKIQEKEYLNKIFPLGLGQRDLALAALRPHIRGRIKDAELLYNFIVAKQKYLDTEGDIPAVTSYIKKSGVFTEEEGRRVLTLIKLDGLVTDLDNYPKPESLSE